jgi:hypothetical protein
LYTFVIFVGIFEYKIAFNLMQTTTIIAFHRFACLTMQIGYFLIFEVSTEFLFYFILLMRGRQESKPAVGGEDRLDGRRQLVMDSGG